MDNLNFINSSSDKNNSQIVIFQQNAQLPDEFATAWHTLNLDAGASASVPADSAAKYYVSILTPDVAVEGGAVAIKAGQTAHIRGDANKGYTITVEA